MNIVNIMNITQTTQRANEQIDGEIFGSRALPTSVARVASEPTDNDNDFCGKRNIFKQTVADEYNISLPPPPSPCCTPFLWH